MLLKKSSATDLEEVLLMEATASSLHFFTTKVGCVGLLAGSCRYFAKLGPSCNYNH